MERFASMWVVGLICLMLTTGCANEKLNIIGMPNAPTEGPPEYIIGWKHGCQTGMTAYSSNYLRTRYSMKLDGEMMANTNYAKGWMVANRYCSYYVSKHLSMGLVDFNTPGLNQDLRDDDVWSHIDNQLNIFKQWRVPWS